MATGLPTLIIGVGGTGLRVLQRVKERLIETYYGEVPNQITLLEFDTALQSPADNFCGYQLSQAMTQGVGSSMTIQEMQLIQTSPSFTMDHAFKEAREGEPRWSWMEVQKLADRLPPANRSIIDGAGAFRPVGRTAFFLNYRNVETLLRQAMSQVTQQNVGGGDDADATDTARSKRNVFLVGSLAGGTGSGGFLDIAAMMRNIKDIDQAFNDIVLIGIVALPRFFADIADDLGRRVPNTYAGLRELDRFMRAHKEGTPYKIATGTGSETKVQNTLFDLCYLVDVVDYNGIPAGGPSVSRKPEFGALPAISDMIVAHTDLRLGLRLNAANINVVSNYALPVDAKTLSTNYSYQARRYYSAFNSHTVIFPREDVIKSLSLRFLLDLIDEHLVARDARSNQFVVTNEPMRIDDLVLFLSKDNPTTQEKQAAELNTQAGDLDLGIFIRTLLQNGLNKDRRFPTEIDTVLKWLVEDGVQRKAVQETIGKSLQQTTAAPADPNNMGAYTSKVRGWQEKYLGPLVDANNPQGDRAGGEWEQAFGSLVTEQRVQMEVRIDQLVLRILNQREQKRFEDQETSMLRANRLGYALALLRTLKDCTRAFMKNAETSFGEASRNLIQLRRDLEEKRAIVANTTNIIPIFRPNPGPDYLAKFKEVAEAERQKLLRNLTLQMAQQFGGDIAQAGRSQSVLDVAIQELEGWSKGLLKVRELIATERGRHETRRKEKYAIGVRSYITDPNRFPKAAVVEDGLYNRYRPIIWRTLLGPDPNGSSGAGFAWETLKSSNAYFDYQITTKTKPMRLNPKRPDWVTIEPMLGEGHGPEQIAAVWQGGSFRMMAEQVRFDQSARIAIYLPILRENQTGIVNGILNPNAQALVRLAGTQPNPQQQEHYLAVDATSDDQQVTSFYSWFHGNWAKTNQMFLQSESDVAFTFLSLYHGLELDQILGFNECDQSYRAMERTQGCLHLFPEERYAANYEDRIAPLKRPEWSSVKRLHPEVVVALGDSLRVRSFALAVVSGMIKTESLSEFDTGNENFLTINSTKLRLSDSSNLENRHIMRDNDLAAARLLQSFQTYILVGHSLDNVYHEIDYSAVGVAFRGWFDQHYSGITAPELDALVKRWETDSTIPSLYPLFNAESKDPRFRDLGVVLLLELFEWRKLRK